MTQRGIGQSIDSSLIMYVLFRSLAAHHHFVWSRLRTCLLAMANLPAVDIPSISDIPGKRRRGKGKDFEYMHPRTSYMYLEAMDA